MPKTLYVVDYRVGKRWESVGLFECVDDETAIELGARTLDSELGIKQALLRITSLGPLFWKREPK
jgi:hypothetical protein